MPKIKSKANSATETYLKALDTVEKRVIYWKNLDMIMGWLMLGLVIWAIFEQWGKGHYLNCIGIVIVGIMIWVSRNICSQTRTVIRVKL